MVRTPHAAQRNASSSSNSSSSSSRPLCAAIASCSQTRACVRVWAFAALLRQFQEEIARLQTMLEGGGGGGGGGGGEGVPHGAMDMEQLHRMKAETEKAETEKQEMMALLEKERAEREAIDAQLAALKAKLVGGAAPGDVTAALLEGPVSPAKQDEATLAAPATPAAVEQSQVCPAVAPHTHAALRTVYILRQPSSPFATPTELHARAVSIRAYLTM